MKIHDFYLCCGDVIQRGDAYYRVDRIDTVKDGPDAGKRDVLTTTQVQRVYKSVWEPVR